MENNKTMLLCFWGHRIDDLEKLIEHYKQKFHNYKIDVLVSTWDDVNTDSLSFKYILKTTQPTEDYIDSINFPYTVQIKDHPHHPARMGHYALFYHSYIISNFIKENKLEYDVLVKTRSDLFFTTDFEFNFDENKVYLCENLFSPGAGVNDQFICGKFNYTLDSFTFGTLQDIYHIIDESWNPEHALSKILEQKNISYIEFNCNRYMLLPDRLFKE